VALALALVVGLGMVVALVPVVGLALVLTLVEHRCCNRHIHIRHIQVRHPNLGPSPSRCQRDQNC
jgi:hypothetical protein